MDYASNIVAQMCATELHGPSAKNLPHRGMGKISARLKHLREQADLSVRDVARYLEFDQHSRYAYYESARFSGDALPMALARKLAGLFADCGVPAEEILTLAGLTEDEAKQEASTVSADYSRPIRLMMEVKLPNEASLTRMFDAMLALAGAEDVSGELARTLALLLPNALAGTTGEFAGDSLDPDFRPFREARSRPRTRAPAPRKP